MSTETVEAPMPGVFYRRPNPDEDFYVEEGEAVSEGDTIGLIGVMKNFHDVTAPTNGTIVNILAENEQEIEAGDVLFELEA